jgi:hypothetical protein
MMNDELKGRIQKPGVRKSEVRIKTKSGSAALSILDSGFWILTPAFRSSFIIPHSSFTFRGGIARWRPNCHSPLWPLMPDHLDYARHVDCSTFPCRGACESRARVGRRMEFSWKQTMYFALMILFALALVALVLLLERSGDPRFIEREYDSRPRPSKKNPTE